MAKPKLMPCPFCDAVPTMEKYEDAEGRTRYRVVCYRCYATVYWEPFEKRRQVAEMWNHRPFISLIKFGPYKEEK